MPHSEPSDQRSSIRTPGPMTLSLLDLPNINPGPTQRSQTHSSPVPVEKGIISSAQATLPLGYIATRLERHQGHSVRSLVAHIDEFVYSGHVTLPEESDQLRLHCHSATSPFGWNATKATVPGAQLFTLTSSYALHRPHCLKSQTSSGYIVIQLERHQGHNTRSPIALFDDLICSAQATLPQASDQLRLHRHSVGTPPRPQCQEPSCSL